MKTMEPRIERFEHTVIDQESEALPFDVRFVGAMTKTETGRLVIDGDGSCTEYEPDEHGGWRQIGEQA